MDILIKNMELPPEGKQICLWVMHNGTVWHEVARDMIPTEMEAIPVPEHNDLADKSVIIERMGAVYEALYDKMDKKTLSECHVAFLKAVMYAPTVIPSTVKIPTEGIEPKGVWDETLTTESEGERTT